MSTKSLVLLKRTKYITTNSQKFKIKHTPTFIKSQIQILKTVRRYFKP